MDLSTITAAELIKALPKKTLESLNKILYKDIKVPWIKLIGNIFRNLTMNKDEEDIPGVEIGPDISILHEFCDKFNQFIFDSSKMTPEQLYIIEEYIKTERELIIIHKYDDQRIYFLRNGKYYYLSTAKINDPIVNDEIIKFFLSKELPVSPGVSFEGEYEVNCECFNCFVEQEENGLLQDMY